jgi:pyrroloquinoline quinone (PQQ) biosynthesis protein C
MELQAEEERYLAALEERVSGLLQRTGKWFAFAQGSEVRIEHVGAHVLEFIHFVHAFPRWIAALLSRTPHYEIRRFLARNLYEEVVEDPAARAPHYEFMIRLGEGAGLTREAVESSKPSPGTLTCMHALENYYRQRPWLEVFAATSVGEATNQATLNPEMRRRYGLPEATRLDRFRALGLSDYHLTQYLVHHEADAEHGGQGIRLAAKYAAIERYPLESILEGLAEYTVLIRSYWDAMYDAVIARAGAAGEQRP